MELTPEHLNQSYYQHLVNKYQRVISYGDEPDIRKIHGYLTDDNYFISSKFTLIKGKHHKVIPLCQHVQLRDQVIDDLQLIELYGAVSLDIAGHLESVQEVCGLDPLPASFMADTNLSRTAYLILTSGVIACVSTVARLSNTKGKWALLATTLWHRLK